MTTPDRKIVDHMLALQAELDTERVRRFAETQRADHERTLRIAAEAKLPSEGEWDALTYCVKVAGGQGAEEDALVAGSWLGHIEARRAVAERATQDVVTGQELAELRGRAELVEVLEEDVERLRADRDAVLAERDEARVDFRAVAEAAGAMHEPYSGPSHPGTRDEVVEVIVGLRERAERYTPTSVSVRMKCDPIEVMRFVDAVERWTKLAPEVPT